MSLKSTTVAAAIAMSLSAATQAADLGDIFSVRGYSTLGAVYSDEDQADFVTSDLVQPKGVGYSDEISYEVDSRMGLQIDMNITDKLSGVVQLISENANNNSWNGDRNKSFNPSLEWANISYRATNNLTIRAGRIVLPFLMVSEFRKPGYASHWLRPPVEVYGQTPITASDGVDASYQTDVGDGVNTLRVHHGTNSLRTHYGATQVRRISGINDTFEYGSLTLRAAYMSVMFEAAGGGMTKDLLQPFQDAMQSLPAGMGSNAAAAVQRFKVYDPANPQRLELFGVGMTYDPGNWLLMSEAFHQASDGYMGDTTGGYVSAGVRINTFTPYATFALAHKHGRDVGSIPLDGLPPPLAEFGGFINGVVGGFARMNTSQQTISVGTRWDVMRNVAIKAQFDHINLDSGSFGLLSNHQPGFVPGSDLNLASIAVDFVF